MRIRIFLFSVMAIFLASMTGCEVEVDTSILEEQETRYFNLYVAGNNYPDSTQIEKDFYFIEDSVGTGVKADTSKWVLMNFLAYTIPDENVVDTYTEEWAIDHNIYSADVLYGPYKVKLADEILGLQKGVSLMKEGGIARMIFKSDLGYGAVGTGSRISGYESLMYDVQLLKVIDDVYAHEMSQITTYLDSVDNEVAIYDSETEATFYYIPGEIGTGDTIGIDSEVEIFYSGQLLDGREFDSNIDATSGLDVTVGEESVIRGWELGLKEFRYGGSGKLLIPHQLAYGEDGSLTSTGKHSIPPYEALLFDISVEPEPEETE